MGFFGILLGTVGHSLSGNLSTGKGAKGSNMPWRVVMQAGERTIKACEVTVRAGQNF